MSYSDTQGIISYLNIHGIFFILCYTEWSDVWTSIYVIACNAIILSYKRPVTSSVYILLWNIMFRVKENESKAKNRYALQLLVWFLNIPSILVFHVLKCSVLQKNCPKSSKQEAKRMSRLMRC